MISVDEFKERVEKFSRTSFLDFINLANEILKDREKLANAIKTHRAQKADDRCIEDDDRLYEALEDGIKCDRRVGRKIDMLMNCHRFLESRCEEGGWPTYKELEEEIVRLKNIAKQLAQELMDVEYEELEPGADVFPIHEKYQNRIDMIFFHSKKE